MWHHEYAPIGHSLILSTVVAVIPVLVLLFLLGFQRRPAWVAASIGLAAAALVAVAGYRMPLTPLAAAITYGAAQGLFPIGWVVFSAILLYNITVKTGKFQIIKDSVGSLTDDRRLQALLIAFAFGAFIEGAAGFGTPVAVAAAMLSGLGFSPLYASRICLLANTAPVAFGSIATPILMLAAVTQLPLDRLSAGVGRICAPVSLIVPAYLVVVMTGWRGLRGVLPAAALCGVAFAGTQFVVSNFVGPQLTDILSSLAAIGSLVVLFLFWHPRDGYKPDSNSTPQSAPKRHPVRDVVIAWIPYALLVLFVLLWGYKPLQTHLNAVTLRWPWPGLHRAIALVPPVVRKPAPYDAMYTFNWLSAPGTACLFAAICSALALRMRPAEFMRVLIATARQLLLAELTIAAVLALAFLMNYSGATGTLGLAFAATGALFPFFSAFLGWLGVFLTGSDTSANALFGNLQAITARALGMNPVLMAASNSSGGVMGKMISLQSVAVAAAATAMPPGEESRLFRFTLKHSIILTAMIGLIVVVYAYVAPQWAP
jgi:L-lactate transport